MFFQISEKEKYCIMSIVISHSHFTQHSTHYTLCNSSVITDCQNVTSGLRQNIQGRLGQWTESQSQGYQSAGQEHSDRHGASSILSE